MKPEVEGLMGCTNHLCIFGHPGGMGTNGPCSCLGELRGIQKLNVTRSVYLLRQEIRRLRDELNKNKETTPDNT